MLEEPFITAAIEKHFQAAAPEINIRRKELFLTTLRLRKIFSPGN